MSANSSYNNVAIFDQSGNQVFKFGYPMKLSVKEEAKLMSHPVEDGTTIVDHLVIEPIQIQIGIITQGDDPKSVYAEIKQLFLSGTLLTVQTKSDVYPNFLIKSLPHEESKDVFNQFVIHLNLIEVKFAQTQYGTLPPAKVKKKTQQTTTAAGEKKGTTPSTSALDATAHAVKNTVTNIFGG